MSGLSTCCSFEPAHLQGPLLLIINQPGLIFTSRLRGGTHTGRPTDFTMSFIYHQHFNVRSGRFLQIFIGDIFSERAQGQTDSINEVVKLLIILQPLSSTRGELGIKHSFKGALLWKQ